MKGYMHSIIMEESICRGCTHCVRHCPTESIRVMEGKARILPVRCVDCGECVKACPYKAHGVLFDSLSSVPEKSNTIVLIPPVFYAHFNPPPPFDVMDKFIKSLGFKGSFDLNMIFEAYPLFLSDYFMKNRSNQKFIPLICPSIPRFLSVRFPDILQFMVKLDSPWEVGARIVKEMNREFQVALLVSCPAQVTSVKTPLGVDFSQINYVIPISHVYHLAKRFFENTNGDGLSRGLLGADGDWLADFLPTYSGINICYISEVSEVLHEVETRHFASINYLELWACRNGCAGGVLNALSTHVIDFNLKNIRSKLKNTIPHDLKDEILSMYESGKFNLTKEITARPVLRLDDDIDVSMRKMEELEHILETLPGIDCGACGAPTCRAFAEDVVLGWSYITDCIFVLRDKLKKLAEDVRDLSHLGPSSVRFKSREVK